MLNIDDTTMALLRVIYWGRNFPQMELIRDVMSAWIESIDQNTCKRQVVIIIIIILIPIPVYQFQLVLTCLSS